MNGAVLLVDLDSTRRKLSRWRCHKSSLIRSCISVGKLSGCRSSARHFPESSRSTVAPCKATAQGVRVRVSLRSGLTALALDSGAQQLASDLVPGLYRPPWRPSLPSLRSLPRSFTTRARALESTLGY